MSNEIQSGYPQLPKDYWQKINNSSNNQNSMADVNTNFALKEISVFNTKK